MVKYPRNWWSQLHSDFCGNMWLGVFHEWIFTELVIHWRIFFFFLIYPLSIEGSYFLIYWCHVQLSQFLFKLKLLNLWWAWPTKDKWARHSNFGSLVVTVIYSITASVYPPIPWEGKSRYCDNLSKRPM